MPEVAESKGSPPRRRRGWPSWPAGIAFLAAIAGGVGFGWSYVWQVSDWWLGGFLALGLFGLGAGLTYWGVYLHRENVAREDFPYPRVDEAERATLTEELERNEDVITRKRFLGLLLGAGAGILAVGALFPVQSLGPLPGDTLFHTKWRKGSRLVTSDGRLVTQDALSSGGFLVAFPEGYVQSSESAVALFKVAPDSLKLPGGSRKLDPKRLRRLLRSSALMPAARPRNTKTSRSLLLCPCHDSAFDILRGAKPIYGPCEASTAPASSHDRQPGQPRGPERF